MGRTHELMRLFGRDISQSRYFQVYFVSWLIIVAVGLGSLSYYSSQVGGESDHRYQLQWTEQLRELNFPKYHFRTASQLDSGSAPSILSVSCTHLNKTVDAGKLCSGYTSTNTCVVVDGPSVTAKPSQKILDSQRIDCFVQVDISGQPLPIDNNLIAWELDNPKVNVYGDNSYASIWIEPFATTWVLISPETFDGSYGWKRSSMVHGFDYVPNTNVTIAQYNISTIIDTFTFWSYKSRYFVSGWNTAALCGGFCFFLYLLQTFFMFLVGISLENDSALLGGFKNDHEEPSASGLTENDSLMRHQHSAL